MIFTTRITLIFKKRQAGFIPCCRMQGCQSLQRIETGWTNRNHSESDAFLSGEAHILKMSKRPGLPTPFSTVHFRSRRKGGRDLRGKAFCRVMRKKISASFRSIRSTLRRELLPAEARQGKNMFRIRMPLFLPERFFDPYVMPGSENEPHRGVGNLRKGIYDILTNLREHYGNIECFISENGMG